MSTRKNLFSKYIRELPTGELRWIGLRPGHKQTIQTTDRVMALKDLGLEGDHRSKKTPGSGRQVTIISEENIDMIARFLDRDQIDPALLRRNLLVRGINLNALRYQTFSIGEAIFEATAQCHPCARMEQALGKGGYAAMMGFGGLCAKIVQSGEIAIGDPVRLYRPQERLFE